MFFCDGSCNTGGAASRCGWNPKIFESEFDEVHRVPATDIRSFKCQEDQIDLAVTSAYPGFSEKPVSVPEDLRVDQIVAAAGSDGKVRLGLPFREEPDASAFGSSIEVKPNARSGWGGIRTPGTVSRTAVFKTAALVHSATHPRSQR